jgi:hypothetical protein
VAFYALDWDTQARAEQITARNTATGQDLDVRGVDLFNGGKYLVYDVMGQVTFRFTKIGGANAVLSGLFFSPGEFFPADGDGDGLPDYFEDRNGDGSASGDTYSWTTYDSPNGLQGSPGLVLHTPIKP